LNFFLNIKMKNRRIRAMGLMRVIKKVMGLNSHRN